MINFAKLTSAACLSLIICLAPATAQNRPLLEQAQLMPLPNAPAIWMADYGAMLKNLSSLNLPISDDKLKITAFSIIQSGQPFDLSRINRFENGEIGNLGFSIFDIGQAIGWHAGSDDIMRFSGLPLSVDQIDDALRAREFDATDYDGHQVWSMGEDYSLNIKKRTVGPFGGSLGRAQRFAIQDNQLLFARSWAGLDALLDESQPRMTDSPDIQAMLAAAYMTSDFGDLTQVSIFSEIRIREAGLVALVLNLGMTNQELLAALAVKPGVNLPSVPGYSHYATMSWQNQRRMTGAIVIPYPDRDTALIAKNNFEALLAVVTEGHGQKLTEILPQDRTFEVIDSETMSVLILGFSKDLAFEVLDNGHVAREINPASLLFVLQNSANLSQLIGVGEIGLLQ